MARANGIRLVGIDGDDTLWHSEDHFHLTEERFAELVAPWVGADVASAALLRTERRNLQLFGYGAKGFTLSMIETALELTGHEIDGRAVERIISFGKELLSHPVELLDGVAETLDALRGAYRLVLVTKGDLFHQESKVAAAGVAELFESVEIVAEKDPATYTRIIGRMGVAPAAFCMVGNSVRSDIAPVLDIGGAGVHVPYHVTWAMEHAEVDERHPRLARVASIREAPDAIAHLGNGRR
ncbi:MAG: HAD family hydrolase [Actinomycetota bacterium]